MHDSDEKVRIEGSLMPPIKEEFKMVIEEDDLISSAIRGRIRNMNLASTLEMTVKTYILLLTCDGIMVDTPLRPWIVMFLSMLMVELTNCVPLM